MIGTRGLSTCPEITVADRVATWNLIDSFICTVRITNIRSGETERHLFREFGWGVRFLPVFLRHRFHAIAWHPRFLPPNKLIMLECRRALNWFPGAMCSIKNHRTSVCFLLWGKNNAIITYPSQKGCWFWFYVAVNLWFHTIETKGKKLMFIFEVSDFNTCTLLYCAVLFIFFFARYL